MEEGACAYIGWEEEAAAAPKGARREVRFYLRRRGDAVRELAVVGRERSLRHMSYYLALGDGSCVRGGVGKDGSGPRGFKSRREVVDWLNAVVSGQPSQRHHHPLDNSSSGSEDAQRWALGSKDTLSSKLRCCNEEIFWLGSPSIDCRKRRHFPSFCLKGIKISVHDFVYILAEEGKRLVAYLEDMYEDSRANKVVVVRWFHKADEVAIGLHDSLSDMEIFFSRCVQHLSFECIDGLATVLSPLHFDKYKNEASSPLREIFVCWNLFHEDDVQPFDITEIEGYWSQEVVRCLYPFTLPKPIAEIEQTVVPNEGRLNFDNGLGLRPRKKQKAHEASPTELQCVKGVSGAMNKFRQNPSFSLPVGSEVEVLSQDSGIRGCWFRASIIKIYKDRVKVRYRDILDAVDEGKNLEEWVLSSRIANPDNCGMYSQSRRMIRPAPEIRTLEPPQTFNVGTLVDVLWHDGCWEGIVIEKEGEDKFHVYFPGEEKDEVFPREKLRHTQGWVENRWVTVQERFDLVGMILTRMVLKHDEEKHHDRQADQLTARYSNLPSKAYSSENLHHQSACYQAERLRGLLDLSKDDFLAQLKWKASRKRSRSSGSSSQKAHSEDDPSSSPESRPSTLSKFLIESSLKVDRENCKFIGDAVFGPSVVPAITSWSCPDTLPCSMIWLETQDYTPPSDASFS
ncbi:hypothetical protein MLD38_003915 [Melastoma candidum]|uniref:Uncharacterized protein n=1 Tax=Melastoma candidum TaxID=119954 RepID=A0ACB9S431_9MYRT|nr:hypothetical protein MLD38_003915 [Melastoma candidum]